MFSFALQCRRSFKGSSRSKEEIQNYLACGKEGTSVCWVTSKKYWPYNVPSKI
uniref:Uncharacterized protein n=1 Tax=Brassica campestris TaxID=3711 RepID=A0A3P5YHT3_BRACM|nr:unnamed protein product [Brassica rapa]